MNRLVKLAGLLAIAPLIALASDDIATLRGGAINQEAQAPAINREVNSDIKLKRNYPMQPPLIPHGIAKYQVDLRANECLACHDWTNAGERNAPTLSMTHSSTSSGVAGLNTSPALQPWSRINCRVRSMCWLASGTKTNSSVK